MKFFKKLLFLTIIALFFIGCNSSEDKKQEDVKQKVLHCPECNMPLRESKQHRASLKDGDEHIHFDDIGCMVLWTKDKKMDLKKSEVRVFSNDTKQYVDPYKSNFIINEKTPMGYGFATTLNECENCIKFDEVVTRMLRGEHMANPKIRQQILGY